MTQSTFQEKCSFLIQYIRSPRQVGSVTPSSKFLAEKMIAPIQWDKASAVAELGVGTGAITQLVAQSANEDLKVFLFEKEQEMHPRLMKRFPQYFCCSDAVQLRNEMKKHGVQSLDGVISSLPFFNFPQTIRNEILNEVYEALSPDGVFVAFQYSLQMKKTFQQKFKVERISFEPLNFPPAFVYVCRK